MVVLFLLVCLVNPHTLTGVALTDSRFARTDAINPRAHASGILGVGVNLVYT